MKKLELILKILFLCKLNEYVFKDFIKIIEYLYNRINT